ncbi:MAG: diguanylate cyclase [Betaproteobacteria bacterium]|nr:diguanylate cyclase [Betaproteobacteria bacterium]
MFASLLHAIDRHLPHSPQGQLHSQMRAWLWSTRDHNALLRLRRARIVATRVRLLAALFLVLTPIWLLVEYYAFPTELWLAVGAARLSVIVAFTGLLLALRAEAERQGASTVALFGLFIVPTLFYIATTLLLGRDTWQGLAQAVLATHTFFPLLLVAGISLFPLTVRESVALILPILLARGWMVWQVLAPGDLFAVLGALWFLLLVAGVGMLAAVSQMGFIIALLHHSIRDPLTGAFSRASGDELLELESTLAVRHGTPFTVAFIDLDRFKEVNDQHGHDAGDQVLAAAAANIASSLRSTDILLRWGGEEFVVLLPNTPCSKAMVGLERLRVKGFGLRPDGRAQTASIGVAERLADGVDAGPRLIDLADQRMYQAKQAGRNRLVGCVPPHDREGDRP